MGVYDYMTVGPFGDHCRASCSFLDCDSFLVGSSIGFDVDDQCYSWNHQPRFESYRSTFSIQLRVQVVDLKT